jgi:hypothetical protein
VELVKEGRGGNILPKRISFADVLKEFDKRNYILLENNYKNNKQKLRYKCKTHFETEQQIRFNDLTTGHGCKLCGEEVKIANLQKLANEQKTPEKEVKNLFKARGYTLLSRYKNAKEPLQYKCPNHPEKLLKIRYKDLKDGNGCRYCAIDKTRLGIKQVKQLFSEKGYELLEQTYINSRTPMRYICPNHEDKETTITVGSLKAGRGCSYCAIENSRGKLSVHYNHDLPEDTRKKDRRYDAEIHLWRSSVFERDAYTCTVCGDDRGGNLNAHHKEGFNWCVHRRYDVNNGVTLCEDCHRGFHSEYGYGDNTENQYLEWVKGKEASE